jgi:CrcB protein
MFNYIMVAIGGALGSVARLWISTLVAQRFGEIFPIGTLLVNVTGSFLMGFLAAFAKSGQIATSARAFLMIGICGGYTTFSSFSLQNLQLLQSGKYYYAALNAALSLVLCLIAVWLGLILGTALHTSK